MKKIIVCMLCVLFCIPALAAEGRWTEGFGQGNLEYFIDKQGLRLYIGCLRKMAVLIQLQPFHFIELTITLKLLNSLSW